MPGLRGALSVRINDGATDRIVTRYCRGLRFTKTAPGGHQAASFTMVLPRNMFNNLGPEDRCYFYDGRTSRTVWEGYLENPTPTDGPDGQQFDVSAVGGMALASDETRGLIYLSRDLGLFQKDIGAGPSSTMEVAESSTFPGYQRLRVQNTPGQPLITGTFAGAGNYAMERAGMSLGALRAVVVSGRTDSGYRSRFQTPATAVDIGAGATISTGAVDSTVWAGTDFASGTTQRFALYCYRTGAATNIASGDDSVWTDYVDVCVLGQRMNRNGTLLTGSAGLVSATQILASQVVEDLLGRLLTFCDAATAQVDTTSFAIDQLSWPDGAKAADVLAQLGVFEAGYLWEILETFPNGKHRFNWRAWPTSPRYEVSVRDGWQQRGSDVDLCNRILVSWNDAAGNTTVTAVTAASLGLTGIGLPVDALGSRVKDADPISLPDGLGSAANATQIGAQILTDKINPPKSGSVVVRRPIKDLLTGNTVMPWEIEPGYVCRVRETGDDLRITQVDYDDDSCSMALTLGTPTLTIDQRLARLARAA